MSWRSRTYDELPALSVRGEELRRSLRLTTVAWMYGIVWMSCASGSQVTVFARMLGFDDWAFGVMTAVPFLATLGQLAAAVLIERTGLKKYQFLSCGTAHRLLWIVIALIPLAAPLPSGLAVWLMLAVLLVSSFLNALATPAWMTWMGDLIPKPVRGRYFANRALYTRPVQILVAVCLGVALDLMTDSRLPETAAAQPRLLLTICIIFAVGGVFGALDILLFLKLRDVLPRKGRRRPPVLVLDVRRVGAGPLSLAIYAFRCVLSAVRQLLLDPLRDKVFRHYVGYGATITFAMAVPGWFFWRNGMENLGFSKLAMNTLFLVISPVLGLIGARWWGKVVDRWGRRPVLILSTMLTMTSVSPWFLATRSTPAPEFLIDAANWIARHVGQWLHAAGAWPVAWGDPSALAIGPSAPVGAYLLCMLAAILGGIAWTGINLAQTAVVLGFADGSGRSKYIAASAVLISVGGFTGGLVGGAVAKGLVHLQTHPLAVGPFLWNNWHAVFAISLLFRMLSLGWLVRMPDPGSRDVRQMVRTMGDSVQAFITNWVFFPLRVFGWGRGDEEEPPDAAGRRGGG